MLSTALGATPTPVPMPVGRLLPDQPLLVMYDCKYLCVASRDYY